MEAAWKTALRGQFGAAIDMLENAMRACPDELWGDRASESEFWYLAYHTLFWLDHYLSETPEGYVPPPPFDLRELDPAGLLPERVHAKPVLLAFLDHGRAKCRRTLDALTDERAARPSGFTRLGLSVGELHLYNLRHVQHHAAQLNLMIRLAGGDPPRWVRRGAVETG